MGVVGRMAFGREAPAQLLPAGLLAGCTASLDCSSQAGPRLRLSCALQESVERTGSGIGGSLLSSRQGSPRTEHGILSTIPASEHFDNPLLTTCVPCLMCAILFFDALLAWESH